MSNKDSQKENLEEAIKKGLQNFKEAAAGAPTVEPSGFSDPALYQDAEGKGAMLGTLDAPDNSAVNMASISGKPSSAVGASMAPADKTSETEEMSDEDKKKKKKEEEEVTENTYSTEEYLSELLGENELTESFKNKLAIIFETALTDRVSFIEAEMQRSFNTSLNEQIETLTEELSEKLDEFLGYVIEEWTKENTVAIERGIKSDIAESFMEGLKSLFESHYIEMPEDKVKVVEELLDAKSELEEQLNNQLDSNLKLQKEKNISSAKTIFVESCIGLTDMEVEKFYSLVEDVEFENEAQFENKLNIIKESFFNKKRPVSPVVEERKILNEDLEETTHQSGVDPLMSAYTNAISFQNRHKNG